MTAPPAPPPATGAAIARGAAWLMGFKLLDRSIGLISTLVLARLLAPGDFGIVAMATAVVALLELMGAFGFDSALIQRQQADRSHYDTAWTFNVIFGVAVSLLLLVLAAPMAAFYREPRLSLILPALAVAAFVGGFENIGTVAFRKELDFRSEFRFLLSKRIATFTVTIGMALAFRSHWALVAGIVSGKVLSVALSYRLHPYRPRLTLAAHRELLHFSKWIFCSNLIQFLHGRSTDFILGRTIGTQGLGVYNIAVELASLPSTELIAPLNRAVYPAYARLASHVDDLRARFVGVFGIICLLAFPVAVGLTWVAAPLVKVLLGSQWLEAIPLMRVFAFSGLVGALQGNLYLVIVALGKPKANTVLSAGLLAVSLPAVIVASLHYGALGAAFAHFGASVLGLAGIVVVFCRTTGIGVRVLAAAAWRPIVCSAAMASVMAAAAELIGEGALSELILQVGVGALAYPAASLLLWAACGKPAGPERTVLDILLTQLRTRRMYFS